MHFSAVRAETERRAAPLSAEDQVVQSMPDASPTKWHRAHTTWFFEQFLLRPFAPGYRVFDERFAFLFNSYYVAAGPRHARPQRGLITRPGVAETAAYRAHVDAAVAELIETTRRSERDHRRSSRSACNHEQQHQELMLTDILHAFAQNPTHPVYDAQWRWPAGEGSAARADGDVLIAGIHTIGHDGDEASRFDNERPAHQCCWQPVRFRRALVTNGEWLAFMADGGYATPSLWLSDGWAHGRGARLAGARAIGATVDGAWFAMTLGGLRPVDPARRSATSAITKPTRSRAGPASICRAKRSGKSRRGPARSTTRSAGLAMDPQRLFALSRLSAEPGALGEYNGKFMVNQMVLRGSSLATPAGHSRADLSQFLLSAGALAIHAACGSPISTNTERAPWLPGFATVLARRGRSLETVERVRRRRARRPRGQAETAAAEIFLRRGRVGAVRSASRVCRNIIRRAASSLCCASMRRRWRRCFRRAAP